jgi:hypothetical protein
MTTRNRTLLCVLAVSISVTGLFGEPGAPAAQIVVCTPRVDCYPGDPQWRPYTPEDRALSQQLEAQRQEQQRRAAIAEQRHRDAQRAVAQATRQDDLRAAAARLRAERRAAEQDARDRANRCGRYRDPNSRSACVTPQ